MEEKNKDILIVAGEVSGDTHAAHLVKELKTVSPSLRFFGAGGNRMQEAGVRMTFNIVGLAVVGIWEAIRKYGTFKKIFTGLLTEVDRIKPNTAILVDYPGFNLRLARELKKRNITVIYYISPQIWAWGQGRIKTIRGCIGLMVVLFKFEEELYKKHRVPVFFAGHPLLDTIRVNTPKEEFRQKNGLAADTITVVLLPGSRDKEVKALLPVMLESAGIISGRLQEKVQFLLLRSSSVKEEVFTGILGRNSVQVKTITDTTYDGLNASDFALVASGTATLETALLKIPMAILYKTSWLTWAFGKLAIKIPYIGLVNVVRGEKFIEEFIQGDAVPEKIAAYVCEAIADPQQISRMKSGYEQIAQSLGQKGAAHRAAQAIVDFLKQSTVL